MTIDHHLLCSPLCASSCKNSRVQLSSEFLAATYGIDIVPPPKHVKRRSKKLSKSHTTSHSPPLVLSIPRMSLYPQTQAYGPMVYSAPQGYGHQPPPYYQQPPPPPQPYYADSTYFGRDYAARLAELTVNSRPIIQNLSLIAQDYQRYADTVVSCIETHIRRVSCQLCFSLSLIALPLLLLACRWHPLPEVTTLRSRST